VEFIELIDHLGQPVDAPALVGHLKQAGVTVQPRPRSGEENAYVEFPDQGYYLLFKPTQGVGPQLALAGIAAYPSGGDDKFGAFAQRLPHDITATDTANSLAMRLGPPAMHNQVVNADIWKFPQYVLVVRFEKQTGNVFLVQVNLPKK
jgi:hypothetical protein